jgi:hypothetical protein
MVFANTFIDAQPERIFSTSGSGVGLGCVNNAGIADGTGCGFTTISGFSGGGWSNNEDAANLGAAFYSCGDLFQVLQGPVCRMSGIIMGSASQYLRIDPTVTSTGNNQSINSVVEVPNTVNGTNTGTNFFMHVFDLSDGTHTGGTNIVNSYASYCNGFGSWAANMWCFYGSGPAGSHLDSFLELGTMSSPSPSGVTNGGRLWYDEVNQQMDLNNNNGGFIKIAQDIVATSAAFATATTGGTCVQNTTAIAGATTAMSVSVSPVSTPGVGAQWSAFVSSAGNVTINECAVATSAGGTIAFNIRVIP